MKKNILIVTPILFLILSFSCEFYPPFKDIILPNEISLPGDSTLLLYIDERADNEWIDQSIYGNTVVVIDLSTVESNRYNSGNFFSGRCDGKITVPNLNLKSLNTLTFSFWIRSFSGKFAELLTVGDNIQPTRLNSLLVDHNKIEFGSLQSQTTDKITIDTSMLNGEWNMITVVARKINTINSSEYEVYADGQKVGSISNSNISFPESNIVELFNNLYGDIDKIRIYNVALNQEQIHIIYEEEVNDFNFVNRGFPVWQGLEFYYTYDSSTQFDRVGYYDNSAVKNFALSRETPNNTGLSAKFDGVDQYMSYPVGQLSEYGGFTISFWCRLDSIDNYHPILSFGSTRKSEIYFLSNQIYAGSSNNSIFSFDYNIEEIIAGKGWKMVVISCEKINQLSLTADLRLYVYSGVEIDRINNGSSDITFAKGSTLYIGTNDSMNNFYSGRIDNVRIYNRQLSKGEIIEIYNFESI